MNNKDEYINWWDEEENQTTVEIPISIVKSASGWVAATNDRTKTFLGDGLHGCSQGETRDEAIKDLFESIRYMHQFSEMCRLKYQRWVPFRKGRWGSIGGTWFVIYGLHFYFRYGKNMKYGWYVPFTKLNISFCNEWIVYRDWKRKNIAV